MAYVNPRTWSTGDIISAGYLNQDVRDNASYLKEHEVPTGALIQYGGISAPTGYLLCDGSAVSRLTYATLYTAITKTSTVTITIASPGVVSWTAHGLSNGMPVRFTSTGALPTGITSNTTYYVVNKATDTFQFAATVGGSAINTSGAQSGTHTALVAPYGYGNGTSTFNLPDLQGRVALGGGAGSGLTARVLGATGGEETHTMTAGELVAHTHGIGSHTHTIGLSDGITAGSNHANAAAGGASTDGTVTSSAGSGNTDSTGSTTAFNVMTPYVVVSFIIKT